VHSLKISRDDKANPPCRTDGCPDGIAGNVPCLLNAVIKPQIGLSGRPENDSRHATPKIAIHFGPGGCEIALVPVYILASHRKVDHRMVLVQYFPFNDGLHHIYKPAELAVTIFLSVVRRYIHRNPRPIGDDVGVQYRQRSVKSYVKNMHASFVIPYRAFHFPCIVYAGHIG